MKPWRALLLIAALVTMSAVVQLEQPTRLFGCSRVAIAVVTKGKTVNVKSCGQDEQGAYNRLLIKCNNFSVELSGASSNDEGSFRLDASIDCGAPPQSGSSTQLFAGCYKGDLTVASFEITVRGSLYLPMAGIVCSDSTPKITGVATAT